MEITCPASSSSNITTLMSMELTKQIQAEYEKCKVSNCRSVDILKEVEFLMRKSIMTATMKRHKVTFIKCLPFGSSATKLKTTDSDLDIAIIVNTERELEQKEKDSLLFAMRPHISNYFRFGEATVIHRAKVPVIKCWSKEYEVDFVLHFGTTIPPNFLAALSINACCQIEQKLIQVCFMLKKWAKHFMQQNYLEKEMLSGLPNSYTLVLLVISMLQQANVLPNLAEVRPSLFDVDHATWESVTAVSMMYPLKKIELANIKKDLDGAQLSVGDMVIQFFKTYGNMDLSTLIIDMKTATIQEKETWGLSDPLTVIDQYDFNIPSRRVTKPFIFEMLCRKSLDVIATSNSDSIFNDLMSMWFGNNPSNGSFLKPKTWKELGYTSQEHYYREMGQNLRECRSKQRQQYKNPKLEQDGTTAFKKTKLKWDSNSDDEC